MGEHLRAVVAACVFAVVVLGAADQRPVDRIGWDPDRMTPQYPRFLEEVARRTTVGDTIAVVVPMQGWSGGYAYAYYRASYFLAGRRVVPLIDPDETLHLERLRDSNFVALWKTAALPGRYDRVWSGHGGLLLRRRP